MTISDTQESGWIQDVRALVDIMNEANAELEREFNELKEKWHTETAHLSNLNAKHLHPAHLKILTFGKAVLPLIFKDMLVDHGHWFLALEILTGHKLQLDAGCKTEAHRLAWIAWAKEQGFLTEGPGETAQQLPEQTAAQQTTTELEA
jgi:hypothetical protein